MCKVSQTVHTKQQSDFASDRVLFASYLELIVHSKSGSSTELTLPSADKTINDFTTI